MGRLIVVILYWIFLLFLCACTAIGIIRSLIHTESTATSKAREKPILCKVYLHSLLRELKDHTERVPFLKRDESHEMRWEEWSREWQRRLKTVAKVCRLAAVSSSGSIARRLNEAYTNLKRAFRQIVKLKRGVSKIREGSVAGIDEALKEIATRLRSKKKK